MVARHPWIRYCVAGLLLLGGLASTAAAQVMWTALPSLDVARQHSAGVVVGSKFYIIGGGGGSASPMAMDIYDTTTGTWTAGPPMPEARRITTAAAVGTRIYVGYSHGGACPASQRMLVFDTTTNTWSLGATLPAPRVAATSAVLDDKIYFVGGLSGASCGTAETRVDVYDPYLRANVVRRDRAALQAKGFPAARC